jgi:hypothetical protein
MTTETKVSMLKAELKVLWRRESNLRTWADMERKDGTPEEYALTLSELEETYNRIDEINQLLKERNN